MLPSEQASEINRQRGEIYGDALAGWSRVAALWTIWLGDKLAQPLTAEDAVAMMGLLKLGRLRETPGHADSLVDVCGYANVAAMIATGRATMQGGGPRPATPEEHAEALRKAAHDALPCVPRGKAIRVPAGIDPARVFYDSRLDEYGYLDAGNWVALARTK